MRTADFVNRNVKPYRGKRAVKREAKHESKIEKAVQC